MFKQAYPERFVQVGIAEQNLFGIAAGWRCPVHAVSVDVRGVRGRDGRWTRRHLDRFPNLNVKIPGSYVGLPTSRAGASHNCIEDIAVMRALPNMRVADHADAADLRAIMRAAAEVNGPVYFRIARLTMPPVFGRSIDSNGARASCCAKDGT
jgi:transketolase